MSSAGETARSQRRASLWFFGAVVTSFLAGLAVGVIAPDYLPAFQDEDSPHAAYLIHLEEHFGLDASQRDEVSQILEARDHEVRELLARGGEANFVDRKVREAQTRTDRRILSVLTPEQRTRFLAAWSARDFDQMAAGPAADPDSARDRR